MDHQQLKDAFLQGEEREAAHLLNQVLRGCVREAFWNLMADEVETLCGARYQPDPDSPYRRAGSETGSVYLDGKKTEITRPRVRHENEGEVALQTYQAAATQAGLFDHVVSLVAQGMSQRGLSRASTESDISRSSISRMWEEKSREQLAHLRERSLADKRWLALMIDGVFVGSENCLVVALGIDADGRKRMLDFETGSSESQETVMRLITRLKKRGVHAEEDTEQRLLVIRDGSQAIKSAVSRHWPSALQQTCLVHLERNILDRLRRRDRAEGQRLFRRLREAQGHQAGEEAFEDLREYLAERNAAAALAFVDRRNEILTVHHLEVPATLHVSLLSTNLIENAIRNWREQTSQVKRWNVKNDMLERWAASGMLWAEAGFRRIRHYEDLPELSQALNGSISEPSCATEASLREPSVAPAISEIEEEVAPPTEII